MNNTQLIVKTDKATIQWLEQNGYDNPQKLPNNYTFPVFVVDMPKRNIFGTNTTCMAASCSYRNKTFVLDFKQLKEKLSMQ